MKKIVLSALFVAVATVLSVNAQPRAIGGRVANGLEASYQHSLGESNMLTVDLGLPSFNGVGIAATYDWIFPIKDWEHEGSWNWYAGVGAGVGLGSFSVPFGFVGVAARIGAEYNFESLPLQLSVGYRPIFGPAFRSDWTSYYSYGLYATAFGVSVRYLF